MINYNDLIDDGDGNGDGNGDGDGLSDSLYRGSSSSNSVAQYPRHLESSPIVQ